MLHGALMWEWEAPVDMITARALNASVPEKNRYCTILDDGDAVMSVENLALAHYAGDEAGNWRGIHSEFRVWATLFGLLFVEVIMLTSPRYQEISKVPVQQRHLTLPRIASRQRGMRPSLIIFSASEKVRLVI